MEDRAKCLGELSANIRAMLVILLVKELIYADIVCDIRLEACGHILVEAFEQGQGEGVVDLCIVGNIVNGIVSTLEVRPIQTVRL